MPLRTYRRRSGRKLAGRSYNPCVPRRVLFLALAAAAAAVFLASRRRAVGGDPSGNGARERTARLRRDLEQARDRLREDIARTRGER